MYTKRVFLIVLTLLCNKIVSLPSVEFIGKVLTPDSILHNKQNYQVAHVGSRKRYATCTGASWFHGDYLATLNLYGEHISTYFFDSKKMEFIQFQQIKKQTDGWLSYPEALALSPDGAVLAVCNNFQESYVLFYSIDQETHLINPVPFFRLVGKGFIHNVRFSPDGTYFAYASFDPKESINIYKYNKSMGAAPFELIYRQANAKHNIKLKAINFTQDGKFVILAYAHAISAVAKSENELIICRFKSDGSVGEIVSRVLGTFFVEDIALCCNDTAIIASNQGNDCLVMYPFDPATGIIDSNYRLVQNPEAQLDFPHGVAVCSGGNYLVATNYGDDSFNLYKIG